MDTYTFSMSNKDKLKDMAIIIESLEKLGVLSPSQQDCYSMDKIMKSKERLKGSEDTWKVGIYIYVREKSKEGDASQSGIAGGPNTTSSSQTNSSSIDSGNSTSVIEVDRCATVPGVPLPINDGASNSKAGAGKGTGQKNNDVQLPYRRKSASTLSPQAKPTMGVCEAHFHQAYKTSATQKFTCSRLKKLAILWSLNCVKFTMFTRYSTGSLAKISFTATVLWWP